MAATLTATLDIDDRQLRVEHTDARRALEVVTGQELITARARLRLPELVTPDLMRLE